MCQPRKPTPNIRSLAVVFSRHHRSRILRRVSAESRLLARPVYSMHTRGSAPVPLVVTRFRSLLDLRLRVGSIPKRQGTDICRWAPTADGSKPLRSRLADAGPPSAIGLTVG
jgi:hypothetical protein